MKNTEPTKAQIRKWVKALRSGEYDQAKNELQNDDGYCCLGVACKLFIPKTKLDVYDSLVVGNFPADQDHSPKWLKDIDNWFKRKTDRGLSNLNDDDNLTFDEIADCLELVFIHKALG